MATTTQQTLAIGELAKRTGVPIKTIRFYSNQRILPPADVTRAGYRRYAENDVVRLETIQTLRAAGFDISTIGEVLDRNLGPDQAIRIQIEAIAVQERTLRRQRLMLERVLERGDVSGHPERGRALALLSAAERTAFLRNQLESGVEDLLVDDEWWTDFLSAAVEDIPGELDDDQLTAWIELVDMTGDPSFAEAIRRTAAPFWSDFVTSGEMSLDTWQAQQHELVGVALQACHEHIAPDSDAALHIIGDWVSELARAMTPDGADARVRDVITHMVGTQDPRLTRYWELIGTIKRLPQNQELNDA